jgi:opacity protein-like surface antigen
MGPELLHHEFDQEASGSSTERDFHHELTYVGIDGRAYSTWGVIRPYISAGVGMHVDKCSYMWQSAADSHWRKASSDDSSLGFSVGAGVRTAPLFPSVSLAIESRWAGNETVVFHRALLGCLAIAW